MKDLETIIREGVDAKAEQDNQIDLNAYENGMRAFAKAINYSQCSTQLPTLEEIYLMGEEYVKELNKGISHDIDRTYDEYHFIKGCVKMRKVIEIKAIV